MAEHNIVVLAGDHCGPEVIAEGIRILKTIEENKPSCSIDSTGSPLTDETLAAADAVLLGSIGGPEWGTGAVRPDAEVERVARLAGFLARGRGDKKVWSLDKANVLATSRLWRKVMTETFEKEFPDLKVEHQLIDSAAMIMVKNPTGLNGVVVTSNLFGDIIRDEASVIPDSIGLLPSASLSGIPDGKGKCNGIYEPIHGSAPDISGKGIVNPIGTLLSVAMLLRYSLNLPEEAKAVEEAVRAALDGGLRTKDLGGNANTKEVGEAVVKELTRILKA
ncbi:3-isopropylmalate dehydrogenase [Fusarium keratoplasticum]|uniref:3-isopropylmalate dehydrogenase n=1 Tax=Fusarium keratoplasticum TaxID=1328300 RepID=A0ACC0R1G7_9HYPO|nr:3-isopropylmalate dehydrogenase [Fusarium keratoplasticum]KAI8671599.1 3-isopropylmalate dehydrogenase [Fusarium keratoplasticum]